MTSSRRKEILAVLNHDWGTYVGRFQCLTRSDQKAFLKKQGYARLGDLLAHILAWWNVGYDAIARYPEELDFVPEQIDVDAFNAIAVKEAEGFTESAIVATFEEKRQLLVRWVEGLPETAFENEKVWGQFQMEFGGHLKEHEIEKK